MNFQLGVSRKFLQQLAVALLFFCLPILAFPELIFGGQTLYWSDITWVHYPSHIFLAEEWLAGRVPLWDPYRHLGVPILAEIPLGVLYPLRFLLLSPLDPSLELSLFILLHFVMAAWFTFMLARSLDLSVWAATVAGLVFGFGGFIMAQIPNLSIMTGAAWLPLIFYGAIQVLKRRTWLAAMLAGVPIALQMSTTQPQITLYSLLTVSGFVLFKMVEAFLSGQQQRNIRYFLHTGLLITVMVVVGVLLATPQLLPTLELTQFAKRLSNRGFDLLVENSLPSAMWLNLLLPSLFGNNVTSFKGGDPFQEVFIYTGIIALLLALFSWPARHRSANVIYFWGLLIAAVLLAMGQNTPLYFYVIQHLPGFDLFRIPARWLMIVNFAIAILAAIGLDVVLKDGISRVKIISLVVITIILLGGLGLIYAQSETLRLWSGQWLEFHQRLLATFLDKGYTLNPTYKERLLIGWVPWLTIPVVLLTVNLISAITVFGLWRARRIPRNVFASLIIGIISFDLMVAGGTTINPVRPDSYWSRVSGGAAYILENIDNARIFPLGVNTEFDSISHLAQYYPSVHRVHSAGGYVFPLTLQRYDQVLDEFHPAQAIQVFGIQYLLTKGQMGADVVATYPIIYNDEDSFVYENKNPHPRAFIVHDVATVDNEADALAYFADAGLDLWQTAILETNETTLPIPQPSTTPSQATIVREHPQQVEIAVTLDAPGYLILHDTFYPGWVATVDGVITPIYRANYIGRAVFVPAGQHQVVFEYQPRPFRIGVWLFGLTLLAIGLVAFWQFRRQS